MFSLNCNGKLCLSRGMTAFYVEVRHQAALWGQGGAKKTWSEAATSV